MAFARFLICDFSSCCETTRPAGNVRDAHGGIGRVHGLPAGAGRAKRIDAQILGLDLDVNFVRFGQHRHRGRGSVNAALLLGGRDALHAMHAAFIFQLRINFLALNRGHHFLHAADGRRRAFENFHSSNPAIPRSANTCGKVRRQKAKLRRRPCRRGFRRSRFSRRWDPWAAAGTSVRARRFRGALSSSLLFVVRHLLHFGIVRFHQHLLRALQALFDFFPLAVFRHHLGHFRMRLARASGNAPNRCALRARKAAGSSLRTSTRCFRVFQTASNSPWRYLQRSENGKGKSENG